MQSKRQSLIEAVFGTAIGFVVSWAANWALWRAFDLHPSISQALWITCMFTVLSLLRIYLVRRLFVRWHRT